MANITVRGIEALRPRGKEYKVTVDRGLYLRVASDGKKSWLVRYVIAAKQIQVRLPRPYNASGDEGYMSLAQALAENARIQSLAREGIDFQMQRAEEQKARAEAQAAAEAAEIPFKKLFETWMTDGVSRKDGNAEIRRTFTRDVLPEIGEKPVGHVTDSDILKLLRAVGRARGAARTAERLLSELRQLFRWAIKRQPWRSLLSHNGNPADLVEIKLVVPQGWKPGIRERVLSSSEIRELRKRFIELQAIYEAQPDKRVAERPLQRESQLALWICLSTGCRIGELVQSEWKNVDFDKGLWFVPRETTKTNVDWHVYLSSFALRHFKELKELTGDTPWCFPAKQRDGPLDKKTIGKQVGDRQYRFKTGKVLKGRKRDNTLVLGGGENGEWTPHDLRRTASTMMQALRISPDVIDRCQNHALPGSKVRRHYLHHDYAEEKREAWRLLGEQLDVILGGNNVVPLLRAA